MIIITLLLLLLLLILLSLLLLLFDDQPVRDKCKFPTPPGRLQAELRCLCFSRYSTLMIAEGADGPVRSDLAMA